MPNKVEVEEKEDVKILIIIPYFIYNSSLGATGKIFCGMINGLSSKYGYCIAKNKYLATFLKTSENSIKMQLSRLIKDGYIKNIGTRSERKLILANVEENEKKVISSKEVLLDINSSNFSKIYESYISTTPTHKTDKEILQDLFDYFWRHYPRREKKKSTLKLFEKLSLQNLKKLLVSLPLIVQKYETSKKEFIPLPTTFISNERWDDEQFTQSNPKEETPQLQQKTIDDTPLELSVQRFKALSDGEDILEEVDLKILKTLGFSKKDAIDEIVNYSSLSDFRKLVLNIWSKL